MSADESPTADATPVKEFFINILTQDVDLIHTIPEFVDNSIDGAARMVEDEEDYSEYFVRIEMDSESLVIEDNCGGIPLNVAEEYAFRFGRPDDLDDVLPSKIGEFGIGMKRSLFKIGGEFKIESKTEDDHFIIEVDVDEWREDTGNWDFPIEIVDDDDDRCEITEDTGTRIQVSDLRAGASRQFGKETFESELGEELISRNQEYLSRDFGIILNRENLAYREMEIFESDEVEPAYDSFTYEDEEGSVDVRMVCGLGERSNKNAGWYVFCNGRLVLEADQTSRTGWGTDSIEKIPNFHGQFNRFRGLVYFNSDDPGMLPWNTTKTDVNEDSEVYQGAKQKMVSLTRPVINFLNDVAEERRGMDDEEEKPDLEKKVEQAQLTDMTDISTSGSRSFSGPEPDEEDDEDIGPEMRTVSYKAPKSKLDKAKDELGVNTFRAVGEETFDYFWKIEGLEE